MGQSDGGLLSHCLIVPLSDCLPLAPVDEGLTLRLPGGTIVGVAPLSMKRLPLLLVLAHGIFLTLRAEPGAAPAERIREGEARQQQLRGEAQKLVEQLDSMLDEYQRNALGGEDPK